MGRDPPRAQSAGGSDKKRHRRRRSSGRTIRIPDAIARAMDLWPCGAPAGPGRRRLGCARSCLAGVGGWPSRLASGWLDRTGPLRIPLHPDALEKGGSTRAQGFRAMPGSESDAHSPHRSGCQAETGRAPRTQGPGASASSPLPRHGGLRAGSERRPPGQQPRTLFTRSFRNVHAPQNRPQTQSLSGAKWSSTRRRLRTATQGLSTDSSHRS